MTVITRFAPSPTGHLHIGGARTAIFCWLLSRHYGGKFLLRIEDTDRERSTPEYEATIMSGMKWLGLDWDEGPVHGGAYGPYFQTKRADTYVKALNTLIENGWAYRCFCIPYSPCTVSILAIITKNGSNENNF